jgi:hypothetical protein
MSETHAPTKQSPEENSLKSWFEVLTFLFKTKEGRFLTTILMLVLGVVVVAIAFVMRPNRIEIITGVGTITVKNGNTQNSVFLLSPSGADNNTPWVKTGIKVKKGDKVKITASGRVHTSLRRLVAEAQNPATVDSIYLPWVGPEGLPSSQDYKLQAARNSYKVLPDKDGAYYGLLLAGVKTPKRQIAQDNIEPIGDNHEFQIKDDGELVLTVNDIWLNGSMKDIYVLPFDKNFEYYKNEAYLQAMLTGENASLWSKKMEIEEARKEHEKRLRNWNTIVKNKAWSLWYEDNTGSFSVSITVN